VSDIEFHPAANAFPMMPRAQLATLAESIKAHGLHMPIILFDDQVLDGRNRLKACEMAGVEPRFESFEGDPWRYAWDANGERRDLDAAQRAAIRLRINLGSDEWRAEQRRRKAEADRARSEAAREQIAAQPRSDDGKVQPGRLSRDNAPGSTAPKPPDPNREHKRLAADAGVSEATAARVQSLGNKRPDLLEKVADGALKLTEAVRQAKRDELPSKVDAIPAGKYRVLYADPPWKYGNNGGITTSGGTEVFTRAEQHYPAMPTPDLCAMPVREFATDDSVLFLWVTSPLLPDGLRVMQAWGFTYKSSFVWNKLRHNFAHYNSMRHEFLLVGTRGSCTPDADKLEPSVWAIERGAHSAKPDAFRDMIDRMYPHGPRLELFARELSDGWEAWGNEV